VGLATQEHRHYTIVLTQRLANGLENNVTLLFGIIEQSDNFASQVERTSSQGNPGCAPAC
jgi:hypothetical protein